MLLGLSAFAQGTAGPAVSRVGRGNFLKIPVYETDGQPTVVNYCVDPSAGSDSSTCIGTTTNCCATPQGALNKIPKLLRQQVTVNLLAGNHPGFVISGFMADNSVQQTTGGLLITGSLVNSTLASGSATGTATGGTAGTAPTFGTLVDSGATWTVNDLVGRFITTATPANVSFPIISNTGTSITIAGSWSAPTGSTTYAIQDPSAIVTGVAVLAASPSVAAVTTRAAVVIGGNTVNYTSSAIQMTQLRLANVSGAGLAIDDASSFLFNVLQIRPSAVSASGAFIGARSAGLTSTISFSKVDLSLNSPNNGLSVGGSSIGVSNSLLRNVQTSGVALQLGNGAFGANTLTNTFTGNEISGWSTGVTFGRTTSNTGTFSNTRIDCSAPTNGIVVGSNASGQFQPVSTVPNIDTTNITGCQTALQAYGGSTVNVLAMTGSTNSNGFSALAGSQISFLASGVTLTPGGAFALTVDAWVAANFSDLPAGSCLVSSPYGSRICAR
jgi:hypothetical protein